MPATSTSAWTTFAKPDDELAIAQRQGSLHRNFQGYSTHSDCDLLAFGISSISKVGPTYSQNVKTLDEYYDRLDSGTLPVYRGIELNADDLLRRSIIQSLMCHFELSIESIEIAHLIDFKKFRHRTRRPARNGRRRPGSRRRQMDHRAAARPHAGRAISMVFDRYLRADRQRTRYSKVI
jgi:oxygen-independent coproporphyrinogen-3 oxidase